MPIQPSPLPLSSYANVQANGNGTLDTAALATLDQEQTLWLDAFKRPVGSCAAGGDALTLTGVNGIPLQQLNRSYSFGTFRIPPQGNADNGVIVCVRVDVASVSGGHGGLTYQAVIGGVVYTIGTPNTVGNGQWIVSPVITLPRAVDPTNPNEAPLEIQLIAVPDGSKATPSQTLWGCSVLANLDTTQPGPAFPKQSQRWIAANTPDDVHFVKTASDQAMHIAARYTRPLITRAFCASQTLATGSNKSCSYYYYVRRGPRAINASGQVQPVPFWFYVGVDDVVASTYSTVAVFIDGVQQASIDITVLGSNWYSCTISAGWQAETLQEVLIKTTGGATSVPGNTQASVTLHTICAYENSYTASDVLVVDPNAPNTRTDPVPQAFMPSSQNGAHITPSTAAIPSAIVGSNWQQNFEVPEQTAWEWTDRKTTLHNRLFEGIYRTQQLIFDCLDAPVSTTGVTTLARWMHLPTRGATGLFVSAHFTWVGANAENYGQDIVATIGVVSGTTQVRAAIPNAIFQGAGSWFDVGELPLPNEGAPVEISMSAGPAWLTGAGEFIRLDGIVVQEVGDIRVPPATYFYQVDEPELDVPPSGSVTYAPSWQTTGMWSNRSINHVRVVTRITGSFGPGDLTIQVVTPAGTAVNLITNGLAPSLRTWYSDDEIGDASPSQALTAAAVSGNGSWALTVTNAGAGTGSIDAFGLELR